jgi:hypothetical protein
MDPLSWMFLSNPGGAGQSAEQFNTAAAGISPTGAPQLGLADILGALKTTAPKPQFSGGVSSTQLPYRTAMPDVLPQHMQAMTAQAQQRLPTLGQLFAGR